jgi:hypothetical protein
MAYNVNQLQQLQGMIGTEAEVPDAMDRYKAMQLLKRKPVRREDGGDMELRNDAEDIASKGRYGDTMLMHVTPDEVRGLSSLRGGVTINPETGLPEAFPWIPILAGAAIGGLGSWATGSDPIKGAAFGAVGGAMPWALGGAAGAMGGGVLEAWNHLGPIGQGMFSGALMGGTKSLFGEGSDSPMRDILTGAAFGGIGAYGSQQLGLSGEQTGLGDVPYTDITEGYTLPTVPTNMSGYYTNQAGLNVASNIPPPIVPSNIVAQAPSSFAGTKDLLRGPVQVATQPISTSNVTMDALGRTNIAPVQPHSIYDNKVTMEALGRTDGAPVPQVQTARPDPSGVERQYLGIRNDPASATVERTDPSLFDQASDWWGGLSDFEKLAGVGGAGMLGYSMLQPQYPEPLEEQEEILEFEKLDPLPRRTPIRRDTDEILAQYLSSSPTAGQPQTWFTEQDINVAKQGGIVSLYPGGSPSYHGPHNIGEHPGITNQRGRGKNDPIKPPAPIEESIEARRFTVNPFSASDTLSRIGGSSFSSAEDEATLQRLLQGSSGLPQAQNFIPQAQNFIPETSSTLFQQQGDAALEDLLNRASNLPQLQEAADGGIVGLATGGNTPVFEGRVMGEGDGMADEVSFGVVPQTPADIPNTPDMALLSSDEYVMPADVVSMLGNGSSTAGSKMLDQFNQLLRKKAHGTNKQQTELNAGKELSSLV